MMYIPFKFVFILHKRFKFTIKKYNILYIFIFILLSQFIFLLDAANSENNSGPWAIFEIACLQSSVAQPSTDKLVRLGLNRLAGEAAARSVGTQGGSIWNQVSDLHNIVLKIMGLIYVLDPI